MLLILRARPTQEACLDSWPLPSPASYGNKNEGALRVHGVQKDLQGPSRLSALHVP